MMRILAFADIHASRYFNDPLELAARLTKDEQPDVVVIAGDIYESGAAAMFEQLDKLFDVPVVFCLGNHEFAYGRVNDVLDNVRIVQTDYPEKLYCLDVLGPITLNGVNFAGNVLWYDGSLSNLNDADRERYLTKIHSGWLDASIVDFNCREANKHCVEQLMPLKNMNGPKVLVTHMVPHASLNWFETNEPDSIFNLYSGMKDLISVVQPDVAICGHTHKRVVNRIGDCRCFNIGNDYCRRDRVVLQKDVIEI